MPQPHIQIILADDKIPTGLLAALQRTGATAGFWPLAEALRIKRIARADAVVVVVPAETAPIAGPLRVLFDRLAENPRATLVVASDGQPLPHLAHPDTLPVSFFSGSNDQDLSSRLSTMLEMRSSLDSLHQNMVANRRSGENIAKRYVNQLRLASQVQREFLPEKLPRFGDVSFDVLFRPVDYVSGDIYDVHRLDEHHLGIAVADATGHGIPAALLTVYIKRALRGKEIENGSYRILAPSEVLDRLNVDILDAELTECHFVAAIYAVLDTRTNVLTFARGGAPYPILHHDDGESEMLVTDGGVVGVLPEAHFEDHTIQLQPGDSLLLYSDGLERIVAPGSLNAEMPRSLKRAAAAVADVPQDVPEPVGVGVATAEASPHAEPPRPGRKLTRVPLPSSVPTLAQAAVAHDPVRESTWYSQTLPRRGTAAAIEQVAHRQRALRRMGYPLDDLTIVSINVNA